MPEQQTVVVKGRTFEAPGKGPWELETTHASRPITRIGAGRFMRGFPRGFAEGTARYGVLLDHLEPGFVHGFLYNQPVAGRRAPGCDGAAAEAGAASWSAGSIPEMRRRHKAPAAGDPGEAVARGPGSGTRSTSPPRSRRTRRSRPSTSRRCPTPSSPTTSTGARSTSIDNAYLHHKYTITACVPVGDFLAGAIAWTGAAVGELMGLLRGRSAISRGFAADELDAAAKALDRRPTPRRAVLAARSDRPRDPRRAGRPPGGRARR